MKTEGFICTGSKTTAGGGNLKPGQGSDPNPEEESEFEGGGAKAFDGNGMNDFDPTPSTKE